MICLAVSKEYQHVTHIQSDILRQHRPRYAQHCAVKTITTETFVRMRCLGSGRLAALSWFPVLGRLSGFFSCVSPISPCTARCSLTALTAAATTTTFSPASTFPRVARSIAGTFRRCSTPFLAASTRSTGYRSSPSFRKLNFIRKPPLLVS